MIRYFIRVVKYFLYFSVLITLMLAIVFYTSDRGELRYFWELIPASNAWQMALFVFAFSAINPFISFVERKVYLNHSFGQDRDALLAPILQANYQMESDNGTQFVFRHKNPFIRFMRMYEEKIILDYSNNPLLLKGMRRDVYRFARNMEYIVRQER